MLVELLIFAMCWSAIGLVIAWTLSHHGHNFWVLGVAGFVYGPLLLLVFRNAIAGQPSSVLRFAPGAGARNDGWFDVLVGVTPRADSMVGIEELLAALGPALGRVCVAAVVDHETAARLRRDQRASDELWAELGEAARTSGIGDADMVLLTGRPASALDDFAERGAMDLIVVADPALHRPVLNRTRRLRPGGVHWARPRPVPATRGAVVPLGHPRPATV